LSYERIQSLSNEQIQTIIQAKELHFKNEDFLLQLILRLIDQNPARKTLLKNVFYPAVSAELMKTFIENFSVEDLDVELFEELKNDFIVKFLFLISKHKKGDGKIHL
jgi:dephospho-CoA kinase